MLEALLQRSMLCFAGGSTGRSSIDSSFMKKTDPTRSLMTTTGDRFWGIRGLRRRQQEMVVRSVNKRSGRSVCYSNTVGYPKI